MRQFGDVPCKSHGFHTARAELDPATMRQHHVAAVSAGSDLHPHVQPFAIRNEPLHSSQAAPSTAALHAVWPLTIQAQGEQVLLPPVCTPVIAEKRPIQVRRFRALLDVRVVNSSILERNSLRIGEVFALL